MTEQQANALKKRIAKEAPQIKAELGIKKKTVWILKLDHTKLRRRLDIVHVDEWEEIKEIWSLPGGG